MDAQREELLESTLARELTIVIDTLDRILHNAADLDWLSHAVFSLARVIVIRLEGIAGRINSILLRFEFSDLSKKLGLCALSLFIKADLGISRSSRFLFFYWLLKFDRSHRVLRYLDLVFTVLSRRLGRLSISDLFLRSRFFSGRLHLDCW